MSAQAIPAVAPLLALVGNPNCGKTALFNLLTGGRQKVANYAGVTVERKEASVTLPSGRRARLLDLPGTYSLEAQTPDERITLDILRGEYRGERRPDLIVCITDATNLRQNLRLALGLKRLGVPMVLALNMIDLAEKRGLKIDHTVLAREIGVPVVKTVGIRGAGAQPLLRALDQATHSLVVDEESSAAPITAATPEQVERDHAEVRRILKAIGADRVVSLASADRIDRIVLHPIAGPIILLVTLFLIFQAVFSWAKVPMDAISAGIAALSAWVTQSMAPGLLQSLIANGVLAGVGSVLVFLPQIIILFFFVLVLEESGYLPRAAFLLDRLMGGVGLSGRSFIPLLSSFACAIPGVMATRTIPNVRDRLTTIMIAPLMTCSARLPVYALIIGAFIPQRTIWGGLEQQGLVLFALYLLGVGSALAVAFVLKRTVNRKHTHAFMMELPTYHVPTVRNIAIGLWQRVQIFLTRVGTIILSLMILLWFLSSFPAPPPGATEPAITYSLAGMLGHALAVVFGPIGFNWQISIALVPGLAAREVAVGALGTVYSLSNTGNDVANALTPLISQTWSMATALSLLAWYVFAPQCMSTLAAVKRETNSWRYPLLMAAYLFALAYIASFVTYHVAVALGAG
jgi:ferrous iron transport protein B